MERYMGGILSLLVGATVAGAVLITKHIYEDCNEPEIVQNSPPVAEPRYFRKDILLPYATGIRQLWFERSANGSFKPYIEVKADSWNSPEPKTMGCLYTPGNESFCAGKPHPSPITNLDFYSLVGQEKGPIDTRLVKLIEDN